MASEDALFKTIGGFGRYQKIQYAIIALSSVFEVDILYFNFISYSPDHWCKVDFQDGRQNFSTAEWKNLTIPWDDKANRFSQCTQYKPNSSTTEGEFLNDTSTTTACDSWRYDDSLYSHTTVTQWDLVCDREWMVDLLPTIHVLGVMVGSLSASLISDRFGRWKGTLIFMYLKMLSNILSMVAPTVEVLFIARFFLGIAGIGVYLDSFVLVLETTSPGHRTWMGVVISMMFSFGSMALAGYAYFFRHWRWLQLFVVIPATLLAILTTFLVYESPRWLIQRGEKEKGIQILKKIGKINGKPFFEMLDTSLDVPEKRTPPKSNVSVLKLFASPTLRKYTFVSLAAWCSSSLIYYALSLSAKSLTGNLFLNFFLLSAVEVPANLLALLCLRSRLLGRRLTQVFAFLVAGVACFASIPLLVIYGKSYYTTALAIVGKFGATAAFTGIYIYTAELFPTEIRNLAVGASSVAGRVGGLLAPYAGGSMGKVWTPLPSLIFGIAGTVSGLLVLLLPETRGTVLKDTVEEQEILEQKNVKEMDQEVELL